MNSIAPYNLHFWPNDSANQIQSDEYFIHDHSYGFASYVIAGKCEQRIFSEDNSRDSLPYAKYEVSYDGNRSILQKTSIQKRLRCSLQFLIDAGSSYAIDASTLHTFEAKSANTLSLILKEAPAQLLTASVFGPIEGKGRLEFVRVAVDEKECELLNMQVSSYFASDELAALLG